MAFSPVLYYSLSFSTILCCSLPFCTILRHSVQFYTILCCSRSVGNPVFMLLFEMWCHTNVMQQRPDFCSLLTNILVIYCFLSLTQSQQLFMMTLLLKLYVAIFLAWRTDAYMFLILLYNWWFWFNSITFIKPDSCGCNAAERSSGWRRKRVRNW